jgi:nicotinamidase-related amidase
MQTIFRRDHEKAIIILHIHPGFTGANRNGRRRQGPGETDETGALGYRHPEPASVLIQSGDTRIVKNYPSAFKKTDLDKMLREKGCNTLLTDSIENALDAVGYGAVKVMLENARE